MVFSMPMTLCNLRLTKGRVCVAGCNLSFSPNTMHSLTNLNMLAPDDQRYSFDHRGNRYGRGEGFGVLVLKRLLDAL